MKSNHVWPALELGLEAAIKPSRIAQVFLLGVAFMSSGFYSESADVADRTDAYLSVGGMGHIKLTDRIYGGLDSRFVVATTSPLGAAFVLAASGGVMFF